MPTNALAQGQIVSLMIIVVGSLGLLVIGAWHRRALRAMAAVPTRSALVGALLVTAGVALLAVRRLDPAALSRVLANLTAVLVPFTAAEQTRPDTSDHLGGSREFRVTDRRRPIVIPALRKELS